MKIPKDGFRQSQAQQLPSMPELPSCPQRSGYELAVANACYVRYMAQLRRIVICSMVQMMLLGSAQLIRFPTGAASLRACCGI